MKLVGIGYLIISNSDLKEKIGVLKSRTSNQVIQFIVYIAIIIPKFVLGR